VAVSGERPAEPPGGAGTAAAARGDPPSRLAMLGLLLLGVAVRLPLFDFESPDYVHSLSRWYDFIVEHGGFAALAAGFSDYAPAYLYLLVVATWVPIDKLYAIKVISVAFDVALAIAVLSYIGAVRGRRGAARAAAVAVFLAPTVVVNGAMWGQCDSIYTTFLVICVWQLTAGRSGLAMVSFGLALAFKQQALFLAPMLAVVFVRKRLSPYLLAVPAAVLLLSLLPAAGAGRPFGELLSVYPRQAAHYTELTLFAANLYQWMPAAGGPLARVAALAAGAAAAVAFWTLSVRGRAPVDGGGLVRLALMALLLMPFLLPGMHQRYFFAADVLAIAYAFVHPGRWFVPLLVVCSSFFSYVPFLLLRMPLPMPILTLAMLIAIVVVTRDWLATLTPAPGRPAPA
jgi:Gpi18-like mannosyltransferase